MINRNVFFFFFFFFFVFCLFNSHSTFCCIGVYDPSILFKVILILYIFKVTSPIWGRGRGGGWGERECFVHQTDINYVSFIALQHITSRITKKNYYYCYV